MPTLTGPRIPARTGVARSLVVFLHGYGADGNDLVEIGRQWQRWLPDTEFVAPHAPERCAASPTGRQWFGLTFRDPHERWRGVNAAAPALDAFLDAELARTGLTDAQLALVGFSQGTMMALHVGLRRARPLAAVVGYSGLLVTPERQEPSAIAPEIRSRPPILLAHGAQDDVIPLDALFMSADALAALDAPVEWHMAANIGHGIDPEGLRQGGIFLARAFGGRTPDDPAARRR